MRRNEPVAWPRADRRDHRGDRVRQVVGDDCCSPRAARSSSTLTSSRGRSSRRGAPALERLVATFGDAILAGDGTLDRTALAARAFADPASTTRMNEILHPAIGVELVRQVRTALAEVVVVAIPLYRAEHRELLGIDRVVCVECPRDVALDRLVTQRGLTREDAGARMAAQLQRDERLALADDVLDNAGGLDIWPARSPRCGTDWSCRELAPPSARSASTPRSSPRATSPRRSRRSHGACSTACASRPSRASRGPARPRRSRGWSSSCSDPRSSSSPTSRSPPSSPPS